ncbi:hypothetical protein LVD17_00225 [Fulvivirga ulvae]|uniref:hypothetical protein n=1 Tax=Fulvivirga ulvae TaxID=2904245 RepID=UPI001F39C3EB|nr:hypothetical protein [Fulvivirga ulvae]UII32262.1 hypothetical protein LVD17_00225 [Fulvivirga ulvae]
MAYSINSNIINRIMDHGRKLTKGCGTHCRDFRIMTSPMRKGTLVLRWTTINIDNPDRPVQCFRYACFDRRGKPLQCSVHYADNAEANEFFESLKTHYQQVFSNDHKLSNYV